VKIKAGRVSLNVIESGSGEPALLFLRYWGGSAQTWAKVTLNLAKDFRCVAYDQRGWGQSDSPTDGYSIRDLASDAKLLVESLRLRRYVLVGHSMGGKAAQFLASLRPVGREALCSSHPLLIVLTPFKR
jgi:pimeloyl-ACP methyl ester carboxylesterase